MGSEFSTNGQWSTTETAVSGLSELQALLDQLPAQVEAKLLRGALRAGQKVVLGDAKAGIHHISHDLADSLRVSTKLKNGRVSAKLRAGNKKAYYPHMVENGTAAHFIKPKRAKSLFFAGLLRDGIQHPGSKKHPFMRPALDRAAAAGSDALAAVAAYLRGKIGRQLAEMPSEQDGTTR